ncbi:helix-turn-helix transcriptional regulator [Serratia fonticola]|uniref:helix-turn-helix transcriptional regulator n=1 Tax=Serratia fonticola TaxID=47917 RepID=UPI000E0ED00A|nr:LuxR C-terminal-related transcriptional regulator [Serratia fonticola]RDL14113.1 DNA-binding NarL/FixJ family response regulator [Serratia fonticola]
MTILKGSVAVVSQCQMFHNGIEALIMTFNTTLSWRSKSISEAELSLKLQPVKLLILSFYVLQTDLSQILRFIQKVKNFQQETQLLIVLDSPVPYLVTKLRNLGVDDIMNLGESLIVWQALLSQHQNRENLQIYLTDGKQQKFSREKLSALELRVINLVVQGLSISEIAVLMKRSCKTVSSHKGNAMHKLEMNNYAQLVAMRNIIA